VCLFFIVSAIVLFTGEYKVGIHRLRFNVLVTAFIGSMVVLLLSTNLFFMLVGWDGLGVTRFLLICFYKRRVSWSARLKTFLINRLGDGLLLVALAVALTTGGLNILYLGVLPFALCLGLFTKSAQFPFSA
jgi:NADH-quinone oxidoreductase subunit L